MGEVKTVKVYCRNPKCSVSATYRYVVNSYVDETNASETIKNKKCPKCGNKGFSPYKSV